MFFASEAIRRKPTVGLTLRSTYWSVSLGFVSVHVRSIWFGETATAARLPGALTARATAGASVARASVSAYRKAKIVPDRIHPPPRPALGNARRSALPEAPLRLGPWLYIHRNPGADSVQGIEDAMSNRESSSGRGRRVS